MGLFGIGRATERDELQSTIQGAEIPALSSRTLQVLEKLRDVDVSFDEVTETLRWDPGLTTRVLRMVNSAAYGLPRRVDDVRHAVSFMGRASLEQLVLAVAVRGALPEARAEGLVPARFWEAAAFRAALARAIASRLHPAREGESFTAGLLQDMAVPVLAHARLDDYGRLLARWHADAGVALEELERDAFGWDHGRVGGLLGASWDLPASLVEAIESHHDDSASDAERLPALRLVSVLRETEQEAGVDALVECARDEYGLDADWVAGAVGDAQGQASELALSLADE